MNLEIFGLDLLSKRIPELLKKKVQNTSNPEKWTWKPHNPEKIRNIKKIVKQEKKESKFAAITNYKPSNEKQNVVFIFAIGNLSFGLLDNLKKQNIKFFYIDYPQFILKGTVKVSHINGETIKKLTIEDLEIDLNDIKVVLWNPPKYPYPLVDFEMIPKKDGRDEFLFRKRWSQFLKDFQFLLPEETIWLPGPQSLGSQDWQNKVGEYNLAINCGLNVPPFIVTNNEDLAINFANEYGKILLREFSSPPFSFPPIKIENIPDNFFKSIKSTPCTFQAYIEKKFELRVVILFDKFYPCKIYSQDSILANEDWRVHDDENVKWELTTIPEDLEKKLLELKKQLHLNWCSVDLIYSTDDEYYFLEANRPGSHYWLGMFVGLDITKEIVNAIKPFVT